MADLKTVYMGMELANPVIAGASDLTSDMDAIKRIEDAGAGALVAKSLFEEQIQLERARFDDEQHRYDGVSAEMTGVFPEMEHAGPDEHLMWVRKTKEAVSIPVIASLNAVNAETWVEWASKLEQTGVDGLELNFFAGPEQQDGDGNAVVRGQAAIVEAVAKNAAIPVAVKMSPFYTAPLAAAKAFAAAGASAVVMFNRMFLPDIDPEGGSFALPMNLSRAEDNRLPLRYAGLLYGETEASICASGGVAEGSDVAKMILAGADAVQAVSTLYLNGVDQIGRILYGLGDWMDRKGYATLGDFRGTMSRGETGDPWAYKRAQYVGLLMKGDPLAAR